jgi:glucan 1,3-beta-glucosidase
MGGEWSLAVNDCGKWLDGVDSTPGKLRSHWFSPCLRETTHDSVDLTFHNTVIVVHILTTTSSIAYTSIGSCTEYDEYFNYSADMKAGLSGYAQANMDALQNWFFWTWKIGNSTELGYPSSPMWHYQLGWKEGWIPNDPRVAGGYCAGIGVGGDQVR